jgi:hypothetical protein
MQNKFGQLHSPKPKFADELSFLFFNLVSVTTCLK